jgi:hypothetical protein
MEDQDVVESILCRAEAETRQAWLEDPSPATRRSWARIWALALSANELGVVEEVEL